MDSAALLLAPLVAASLGVAACGLSQAPESAQPESAAAEASQTYTPPREGASSLVDALAARRDANGEIVVNGTLSLPSGTRTWVELYEPGAAAGADPIGRAELYLGPGGAFEAGPFKLQIGRQVRVLLTSHFSRSWQGTDVLALVGVNGTKLPRSALTPNNPQAPQSGAHLEHSTILAVE